MSNKKTRNPSLIKKINPLARLRARGKPPIRPAGHTRQAMEREQTLYPVNPASTYFLR